MAKRKSSATNSPRAAAALREAPIAEIAGELDRRTRILEARRREVLAELDRIERELAEARGAREAPRAASNGRAGGRAARTRGAASLADRLEEILRRWGRPMSVPELAAALKKAGVRVKAANFNLKVNDTLRQHARFERVWRGVYAAKGMAPKR